MAEPVLPVIKLKRVSMNASLGLDLGKRTIVRFEVEATHAVSSALFRALEEDDGDTARKLERYLARLTDANLKRRGF